MAKSLALAQGRSIPLSVVGVGTTAGGIIPDPKREANQPMVRSVLNRAELTKIATAGGGRYFELDREADRDIANQIIDQTRRSAGTTGLQEGTKDLYWNFLFGAGVCLALGVLFLRDRTALALQLATAAAVLIFIQTIF